MNFQPTIPKSILPTSIYHSTFIPSAFTLTIILFPFLWFYTNHCTLSVSHFTSATGFLKKHLSGNLENCLRSLRGFPFSSLKYFKHFISLLKPSKAFINNYSSLLAESKVLFDTLLKCDVIHVCFFRKNGLQRLLAPYLENILLQQFVSD